MTLIRSLQQLLRCGSRPLLMQACISGPFTGRRAASWRPSWPRRRTSWR